ncbi:hypothetical protein [Rhodoferax saidenbachensis]|uniref:Uncharacterized protein n=1 Tax=Rhodoferax saidenbachensis TaxID=1484693 RepID=A0ABU1ZQH1_9BURK|nr:hypothetical protein [Rhodoferax saidenbachensis]MDR7307784.1 hypothetical protein [Rhodoferax saidenbachensis]
MNAAQRLLRVYEALQSLPHSPDLQMSQVWSRVLLVPLGQSASEDEITEGLLDLRAEIELVKWKLAQSECPPTLMQPGLDRLRDTASATYLNQGFSGLRSNLLAPECSYAFNFAVWMLRDETEPDIDESQLSEVQAAMAQLEIRTAEATMSPALRIFLQKHIKALRRAIRRSKVLGPKATEETYKIVRLEMAMESKNLASDIGQAEKSAPGIVTDFCSAVEKVGVISDAVTKVSTAIPHFQAFVQQLLS